MFASRVTTVKEQRRRLSGSGSGRSGLDGTGLGGRERSGCRSFVSVTNESLALSLATHLFSPVTKASDNADYYRLQRRKRQRGGGRSAVIMGQVTKFDDVAWELEGQFITLIFRAFS